MKVISRVAMLLLFLAPLGGSASAQSRIEEVLADTAKTKVDTTAVIERFSPSTTSYFKGSDVDMALGSSATVSSRPGGGWSLLNSIMVERKKYRGRDMEDLVENLMNHASKAQAGLYNLNFNVGEEYSKKKTLGLGRFGKDIVIDNQTANVSMHFIKPVLGSSSSIIAVGAGGAQGLNDFKYDRSLNGMMSSALNYDFRNLVRVGGGFGTTRRRESSKVGKILFGPLPSSADTLHAKVAVGKAGAKLLDFSYDRTEGEDRRVTPPRGNSLEILDDPSKAKREMIRTTNEQLGVTSLLRPFPFASVSLVMRHNSSSQVYAVDTSLTKSSRSDDIDATTSYNFAGKGTLSFDVYTAKSLDDFGSASISSYREKEHQLSASLADSLTSSLSLKLSGVAKLQQRFFLKSDVNPRDADYLYYRGDAAFGAAVFPGITTGVSATVSRYETRNIDRTLSGDNRVDFQYQVVPQLSVKPARWLTLSQQYTIKIDYTDFVYTANKNYLNRTTLLSTDANFVLSPLLTFVLTHRYYMKDTGSYLSSGAKKLYNPNNRNKEHNFLVNLSFKPLETLGIKALGDFTFQRNDNLGNVNGHRVVTNSSNFQSGGMLLGVTHSRKIGPDGEVDLNIAYNRRYGQFITAERKEYWDIDSQIVLGF
jgi:hypothetical protein